MADIILISCITIGIVAIFRFQRKQKRTGKHCCGDCTFCKGETTCKEVSEDTVNCSKK